eukprot:gene17551-46059_t
MWARKARCTAATARRSAAWYRTSRAWRATYTAHNGVRGGRCSDLTASVRHVTPSRVSGAEQRPSNK